ncbi:MAG: FtsX-like permease family protein, partial [Candidatus Heimdallarchaeaceae archaeon]
SYTQTYLIDRIADVTIQEMNLTNNILQRDLFFKRGTFTSTYDPIAKQTYLPNLPLVGLTDRLSLFLSNHLTQGRFPENNGEVLAFLTSNSYNHSTIRVNSTISLYIPISLLKQASLSEPQAQTEVTVTGIVIADNLTDFSVIGSNKGIPFDVFLNLYEGNAVLSPWIIAARILSSIQLTYGFASIYENLFYDIGTIDTFNLDGEIAKLKELAINLKDSYLQMGGYTGVDINSYLLTALEEFKAEYNLYQIFMFAFLAPIIVLTLILTIYAANLVRKKRERQLTILTERGTTKIEIGSYLALESLIFGIIALFLGIALGIPISALLTKSTGFLSFSNQTSSLQLKIPSLSQALFGSLLVIFIIQTFNVITLLKTRSIEDYGKVEKTLPSFYRYYVDIIFISTGAILWFIYQLPVLSGFRDKTTKSIGIPAMIVLLFGVVLLIQRLLPLFSKFILKITQFPNDKIRKKLRLDIFSLGIKEITRYQSSFVRSSVILSLSFAIVVSAIVVPASYQKFNTDGAYYDLGADIVIENFPLENKFLIGEIENLTEIQSTCVVKYAALSDVSGDYAITHAILGIEVNKFAQTAFFREDFSDYSLEELLTLLSDETTLLAQEDEIKIINKGVGDSLILGYRAYNETRRETDGSPFYRSNITVEIAGLFKYWPVLVKEISTTNVLSILNHFVANISIFNKLELSPFEITDYLLIKVNQEEDIEEVTKKIKTVAGSNVDNVYSKIFVREGSARSSILYSAINSTLIMSFTINSLIIALYASVQLIERSREIATMKAIGVSKTQLLLLFLSEYATLLIFSTIMGLLSGLFSSWMLMNIITINRSIPPFIMKFPGFYIALVAIILFLTAFIGALIPSLTATNKNIGTDLRQSS